MPDLGLEVLWKGKNFIRLLGGLWVALRISLIAAGISIVLGILLGVAASRKRSVASVILRVWLGVIHIMPQMVLLFLMYFGTTRAFGWVIQRESAEALGLKPAQVYRWIILPQAVRQLIPQSINLITRMIKTTSLVTLIGVVEILKVAQQIIEANRKASPNAAFGVYLAIFILYYLACRPLSLAAKKLEKHWR